MNDVNLPSNNIMELTPPRLRGPLPPAQQKERYQNALCGPRINRMEVDTHHLVTQWRVGEIAACVLGLTVDPSTRRIVEDHEGAAASYGSHTVEEIAEEVGLKPQEVEQALRLFCGVGPQTLNRMAQFNRMAERSIFTAQSVNRTLEFEHPEAVESIFEIAFREARPLRYVLAGRPRRR